MVTFNDNKIKAVETINKATMAILCCDDYKDIKTLAQCIGKAAELLEQSVDFQVALESNDIEAMKKVLGIE